jgi:O-antigen ligase
LFLVTGAASVIRAVSPLKAVKDLVQFGEYFVAAYLLFDTFLAGDRRHLRWLLLAFLGTTTAIAGLAAAQYMDPGHEAFAVGGTFGNANVLGGYLALAVPLLAGIALWDLNTARRVWAGVLALGALGLILSGGAFAAVVLGVAFVAVLRGRAAFLAAAAILILATALVVPRLPRDNGEVLIDSVRLYDDRNAVSPRYTEWQAAVEMVRDHPFFGVGMGNYQDNIGRYYGILPQPTGKQEPDSQNLFLVLASTVGWTGLALFAGMLLFYGRGALQAWACSGDGLRRGTAAGAAGSLLAFGVAAVWSPLLVRGIGIPLALVFALAAAPADNGDGATAQPER